MNRVYTFVSPLVLIIIILVSFFFAREVLQYYFAIFPILLVPFFIVNGILTGTGIDQEVFSYNPLVIAGIRIFTVPLEDIFFAGSLLLTVLMLTDVFENRLKIRIAK